MTDKVYTIEEIKQKLCPIFVSHNVKKALVFGSYGKGCAVGESDVDIYVDSNLHGLSFIELVEDIREVLDKDVDVIDARHIDKGKKIEEEIHNYGEVLYEK